jgi:hypothetical protein
MQTIRQYTIPISYFIIGTIAIALRVLDLGGFLTVDEATTWVPNSYRFLRVLQSGSYATTPFMGHPAITTMWLGTGGVVLRRLLFDWGILTNETYPLVLALNRLPVPLVTVAGLLLSYRYLQRIFPAIIAALAALLWATDPFIIAFSRVLHMDALMGTFATVALLAACLYWYRERHWHWLIISGIGTGLAILSKLPAFVLFPIVGVIALTSHTGKGNGQAESGQEAAVQAPGWQAIIIPRLRDALPRATLWAIIAGITVIALWPTFWTNPIRAYEAIKYGVEVEGGSPHLMGNFFMGKMNPTPGPLFYPVALAMRTTPFSLVGLVLLPWAMRDLGRRWRQASTRTAQQSLLLTMRTITVLTSWIILFVAGMSCFPLKMNRYLVPTFPALDILTAFSLVWATTALVNRIQGMGKDHQHTRPVPRKPKAVGGIVAVIALAAVVNAAWYHPYPIVYFNQLLGGAKAGARTFLIGWGEGTDQMVAWLNQQPDITNVVTVSRMSLVMNPYLRDKAQAYRADGEDLPPDTGYLTIYARHTQWDQLRPPYTDFHDKVPPLLTVNLHGVDYGWIYQVPQTMPHTLTATFGESIRMQGYAIDTSAIQQSSTLTMTIQWQVLAPVGKDYAIFVHVFDEQGKQVGQLDVPLLDPRYGTGEPPAPTRAWQPGRVFRWLHPVHLPTDLPNGEYTLAIGVYDPSDWSRLPLDAPPPPPGTPDDGVHALFLEPLPLMVQP